jgi:RNA polymerase sigma factor (sigma-70 family)
MRGDAMPDTSSDAKEKAIHALKDYGDAILRMSYSYLHNLADAEDILQDTLFSLMKVNPDFSDADHEKAWLLRVAINLCKNKLKSSWFKRVEIHEDYPDEKMADSMSTSESMLLDIVNGLQVKYREVIHLFYYEGYSTSEIAGLLHKNESTIRSLLHRAREKLKENLKGDYDFDGQIHLCV